MERKTAACKISDKDFRTWLGKISGMSRRDCRLLQDTRIAEQFLIAWHFLETICFKKNCGPPKFEKFSKSFTRKHSFKLDPTFQHFHDRYQDATKLRQLMHKSNTSEISRVLAIPEDDVSNADKLHLILIVVHRFRNNMFHGNKGLASWLNYKPQISHCIGAMQIIALASLPDDVSVGK